MRVGITVFGSAAGFPVDEWIEEYKQFVEDNSKIRLDLVISKYPKLSTLEIPLFPDSNSTCHFANGGTISTSNISKLPKNVAIQIIMWYNQGLSVCWEGATWPFDQPFVSIPFGEHVDDTFGLWKHRYAQVIFHEWMHGLRTLFSNLGYPDFPSADSCPADGFPNDYAYGWQNCYKYFLSLITDDMYISLGESITTTSQKISTAIVIGGLAAAAVWTISLPSEGNRGIRGSIG